MPFPFVGCSLVGCCLFPVAKRDKAENADSRYDGCLHPLSQTTLQLTFDVFSYNMNIFTKTMLAPLILAGIVYDVVYDLSLVC